MLGEMPKGEVCPIGPLLLHTYNAERTECIWCGPGHLGHSPGRWVSVTDDGYPYSAWTTWGPLTKIQTQISERQAQR